MNITSIEFDNALAEGIDAEFESIISGEAEPHVFSERFERMAYDPKYGLKPRAKKRTLLLMLLRVLVCAAVIAAALFVPAIVIPAAAVVLLIVLLRPQRDREHFGRNS